MTDFRYTALRLHGPVRPTAAYRAVRAPSLTDGLRRAHPQWSDRWGMSAPKRRPALFLRSQPRACPFRDASSFSRMSRAQRAKPGDGGASKAALAKVETLICYQSKSRQT